MVSVGPARIRLSVGTGREVGAVESVLVGVEVLEGLGKYLKEYQPTMLIEILNDEVGKKVETSVKEHGYLYFNIDELTDEITPVDKITKSDY